MIRFVKLKPAEPGLKVRMPPVPGGAAYLPKEGETVQLDTYWVHHLNDGSVVEVKEDATEQPTTDQPVSEPVATPKKGK